MRINKAFLEKFIYRIGPVDLEIWECEWNMYWDTALVASDGQKVAFLTKNGPFLQF